MDGSVRQPTTLAAPLPSVMSEGTRDAEPSNLPAFKAPVQLIQGVFLSQPDIERSGGVDGVVLEEREEAFEGIHEQPRWYLATVARGWDSAARQRTAIRRRAAVSRGAGG